MPVTEHLAALKGLHPGEEPLAYTSHGNTLANPGYCRILQRGNCITWRKEPIYAQPLSNHHQLAGRHCHRGRCRPSAASSDRPSACAFGMGAWIRSPTGSISPPLGYRWCGTGRRFPLEQMVGLDLRHAPTWSILW